VRAELAPGKSIGYLADGTSFVMRTAICASGVDYRRLNLWNEERLRGAGVFYAPAPARRSCAAVRTSSWSVAATLPDRRPYTSPAMREGSTS
jgi:hypothetical protein